MEPTYLVDRFHDPAAFLAAADELIRADPFTTNVVAVNAIRAQSAPSDESARTRWFVLREDGGRVVGVALRSSDRPLFLSRMPAAAAVRLVAHLAAEDLSGVEGELEAVRAVAEAWTTATGRASRVDARTRMHRLDHLFPPADVAGTVRLADEADLDLVAAALQAFDREALPHAPARDRVGAARRRITGRELHLWEADGGVVALAGASAPAADVARIGPVYTLPEARRRGFGAAVTAAATAGALEAGALDVVLYTDLANPTSNGIYRAIGYRPHHDGEERTFLASGDGDGRSAAPLPQSSRRTRRSAPVRRSRPASGR